MSTWLLGRYIRSRYRDSYGALSSRWATFIHLASQRWRSNSSPNIDGSHRNADRFSLSAFHCYVRYTKGERTWRREARNEVMEVILLEWFCSLKSNDGVCQRDASRTSNLMLLFCFWVRILRHMQEVTLFLSSSSETEAALSNMEKNHVSQ
jgi:hypothetical protein